MVVQIDHFLGGSDPGTKVAKPSLTIQNSEKLISQKPSSRSKPGGWGDFRPLLFASASTSWNLWNLCSRTRIHWCEKIKDEVEKLAYQLNEEDERTERPIRRLGKVMYGTTCADMQVDVMGECLSSIQHVVGVRSVFLAKRLHAV
ncbi:uncharacterized protein TNCV_1555121 [Trichonephila clavipes]|nr:uncharacterized protein TNCV_1555121 [Trichonephila clavipes]